MADKLVGVLNELGHTQERYIKFGDGAGCGYGDWRGNGYVYDEVAEYNGIFSYYIANAKTEMFLSGRRWKA